MKLTESAIQEFQQEIWKYYEENKRVLPWRNVDDPYKVVISEIMLQQTQVVRVLPKYEEFLKVFPNFESLACASTHDLLSVWKGLGYNRRGLYLQKLAQIVVREFDGILPQDPDVLLQLPGVGKATAASISTFAYNTPTLFIETNIRTVFLYFFFKGKNEVHDNEILPLVEQTLDRQNPREWYYALMDYGVMLKSTGYRNLNQVSKQYVKQSKFEGSRRQIRGKILEYILKNKTMRLESLKVEIEDVRLESVLEELVKEKFLVEKNKLYSLA